MTRSGKEGRETQILFLPLPDRESEDIFPCCCILNAWSRLCGCRVSEPTRLTVCFDDGVCVAARGVSERGVSEQTEPGERCGRRNELLLLPRQVSPISFWLSLIPALTCCESGCVGLTARVLQMKIYEVHRGREMGGARRERGVEEEEVLRRGRKQSPASVGLLSQALRHYSFLSSV